MRVRRENALFVVAVHAYIYIYMYVYYVLFAFCKLVGLPTYAICLLCLNRDSLSLFLNTHSLLFSTSCCCGAPPFWLFTSHSYRRSRSFCLFFFVVNSPVSQTVQRWSTVFFFSSLTLCFVFLCVCNLFACACACVSVLGVSRASPSTLLEF